MEASKELKEYYENNKEKLRRLAKHGEPTVRAMALAVLKRAGDPEVNGSGQV